MSRDGRGVVSLIAGSLGLIYRKFIGLMLAHRSVTDGLHCATDKCTLMTSINSTTGRRAIGKHFVIRRPPSPSVAVNSDIPAHMPTHNAYRRRPVTVALPGKTVKYQQRSTNES